MSTTAPPPQPNDSTTPTTSIEGVRASTLRTVFHRALHKALSTCSYRNFEKCFPTTARNNPVLLKTIWQQITQHWETRAKAEYELILQSRNVVEKLNMLDILEREAKERKAQAPEGVVPVAPSTLPPVTVVGAHLTPLLQEAMGGVNQKIEGVRQENLELAKRIEAQNREMEELRRVLEGKMEEMEKAVEEVVGALEGEDTVALGGAGDGDGMVGMERTG